MKPTPATNTLFVAVLAVGVGAFMVGRGTAPIDNPGIEVINQAYARADSLQRILDATTVQRDDAILVAERLKCELDEGWTKLDKERGTADRNRAAAVSDSSKALKRIILWENDWRTK